MNLVQGTKRPQGGEKIMWPNVDASSDLGHGGYKVPKGVDVVIYNIKAKLPPTQITL